MILPLNVIVSLHSYMVQQIDADSPPTEAQLESMIDTYARSNSLDRDILRECYLLYATLIQCGEAGLLDEILMEIASEQCLFPDEVN